MKSQTFLKEARLMLESIPAVDSESCFALKGGTAINFFLRDMPRLSVDIDLTYLPLEDRSTSLAKISESLKKISEKLKSDNPSLTVQEGLIKNTKITSKLYVNDKESQIVIEPNLVLRGTVFPVQRRTISQAVKDLFEMTVSMAIVSEADLYGGKLCAALDRQHPRDLFDIKILFETEGITDGIRRGFIIYLVGHDETISDLLKPKKKDLKNRTSFLTNLQAWPIKK
jgi:predicted nucleotidyltransferase component of viral defense system